MITPPKTILHPLISQNDILYPSKHTTSFWRLYNVHNVKTTSYGRQNNVVCVLGYLLKFIAIDSRSNDSNRKVKPSPLGDETESFLLYISQFSTEKCWKFWLQRYAASKGTYKVILEIESCLRREIAFKLILRYQRGFSEL